jgi:hypothetical protein
MSTTRVLTLAALALGSSLHAQHPAPANPPTGGPRDTAPDDFVATLPGTVKDLARDSAGRLLYCTAEGEVGRITPGIGREVLADAASGPFPNELRAVAETPGGDVAVLDVNGDIRVLTGGNAPASLRYDDLYMIQDASDLVVDASGNYLVASATPSNGQRGINWISSDGVRWGYYLVAHQPLALAHDPLTGGIVLSETTSGGNLRLVEAGSETRQTSALDTSTHPGISATLSDGDVAVEEDGDVWWVAGGTVRLHRRATGSTTTHTSGLGTLRGAALAASSPYRRSSTGWSLFVAEGANPTRVRELPNAGAPGATLLASQGYVPGRGAKINVTFGFQVFDLAADNDGNLLLGGSSFGTTHYVKRVTLTGTPSIATVATSANGLTGIVEGLVVDVDDAIYALTRTGSIHKITEGPLSVTTIFSDPASQITAGKDLALDVDGTFYVATRESWDFGKVMAVTPFAGGAAFLTATEETRGLAASPGGGMYLSQWHNTGFHGTVERLHFADNSLESLPGFAGMNYTNDSVWGDGDLVVDADGSIYTLSEDDWSLVRYDADEDGLVRIGSGYLNHPSGLAIAPSTASSGSTTGWSLYVAEFDNLWERASFPPPASTFVDAALGLVVGRYVAGAPDPRHGKPRALAPAPGGGVLVGTARGVVWHLDPASGALERIAGPEHGLVGEIVALGASSAPGQSYALSATGELFLVRRGAAQRLALAPGRGAAAAAHFAAHPARRMRVPGTAERDAAELVLDGWVVWGVPMAGR